MIIGEVVEISMAFKSGQKDDNGNVLPIGSIEVRIGAGVSHLGALKNVYARPAVFNRRIPLIGEHVYLMLAPTNDESTDSVKGAGYIYFSPINASDDLVMHRLPNVFTRSQSKTGKLPGKRKHDKDEPGYTFPKKPKRTDFLQPYEGDDMWEGRFGQSIRYGSSVVGDLSNYEKKPTWKGGSNTDPLMILRVKKPDGSTSANIGKIGKKFVSNAKYTIEDLKTDDVSIYLVTTQMLTNLKPGFDKNMDVKTAPNWSGKSQAVVDAERIILNAKKDKLLLVGSTEIIISGKKILFQDDKYKVYLHELMDWLKKWIDQDTMLAQGTKMYATACGPTSTATNMSDYIKLSKTDWQKFKMP